MSVGYSYITLTVRDWNAMTSDIMRLIGELGEPRHLVLGLDPGIASCGFALIDTSNQEILEMGSRLFDAPRGCGRFPGQA